MPRKDLFHEAVRNALIKEGWKITHDPFDTLEGHELLADETLKLIVFHPVHEEIEKWIE